MQKAQATAVVLGISLNSVITNELNRFGIEKDVVFHTTLPVPNHQYRWLQLRLPHRTLSRFNLLAQRTGIPARTLMQAELQKAAEAVD